VYVTVSVLVAGLLTSFAYIVDHAMSLDAVSESRAASLLSVLGLSSVVTLLLVGWVCDQPSTDATVLYTGALLVAGASTVALPSLRSYPLLVGYQVVYGACCGTIITATHERDTVSSWSWLSLVYCTEPTTKKWKNRRKSKKTDVLRSIGESVESVLKKKRNAAMGTICRKEGYKSGMKE